MLFSKIYILSKYILISKNNSIDTFYCCNISSKRFKLCTNVTTFLRMNVAKCYHFNSGCFTHAMFRIALPYCLLFRIKARQNLSSFNLRGQSTILCDNDNIILSNLSTTVTNVHLIDVNTIIWQQFMIPFYIVTDTLNLTQ